MDPTVPGSSEPIATALFLLTFGGLLIASAILARASQRVGLPVVLLFLALGVAAGEEGIGGIRFWDYEFAYRVGTIALVLILLDGGFNTPLKAIRSVAAPAVTLATLGVIGTALVVAAGAAWLGLPWSTSLLLGAIVSSTDAAAIFAVLRGSGVSLRRRVATTLEVEGGINDPLAVILTTLLTQNLVSQLPGGWALLGRAAVEMGVGFGTGWLVGKVGVLALRRIRFPAGGLYPAFTLALAFVSYGAATLLHGSGFLAVFVAAVLLGNVRLPYRASLVRAHDTVAWLSQIVMFLILGLLVSPSRLMDVAAVGLAIGLFVALIARPVVTTVLLAPFSYDRREIAYIGLVGLRGAVPIILATFPVLAKAPGAEMIFNVVFFIVVVMSIIPGTIVPWLTRTLGVESDEPPAPHAVLEIESPALMRGDLVSYYIDEELAVAGATIGEMPFPEGAAATLIVRGDELIAPKGSTVLMPGDHVYVLMRPEDRPVIQLMFGRPEA
ncbi:MAG TPA: potassium/proton antiporter [Gemmatimonadaceae bacterium]|nr:potassium/proton antiporter [Gemmatimonadaceae bacterium]